MSTYATIVHTESTSSEPHVIRIPIIASSIEVASFLELAQNIPVVDVRAPIEFAAGHIPGARNIPLFDDLERAAIGTTYCQQGRRPAILQGLGIAGPKMQSIVESAFELVSPSSGSSGNLLVHCWRGGMRSQSVGWLLQQAEFNVNILNGGYKSYRSHARQHFKRPYELVIISGLTGAGKTHQLERLKELGEQIIDLEHLASHRGSAFGGIGREAQPSVEQFENDLATELAKLDSSRRIWVEDESRKIGRVVIPDEFFIQMRAAPDIFVDVSRTVRAQFLAKEYGSLPQQDMADSIRRITKRLGGNNVNEAIQALENGQMVACAEILLGYYDKIYLSAKSKGAREVSIPFKTESPTTSETIDELVRLADRSFARY